MDDNLRLGAPGRRPAGGIRAGSFRRWVGALALGAGLTGCAIPVTPVLPHYGTLFNETTAPVDITFHQTEIGGRVGRSSATSVLGLLAFGDCSVQAAARNGGVDEIDHVDCRITNVLFGLYGQYEMIVSGRAAQTP